MSILGTEGKKSPLVYCNFHHPLEWQQPWESTDVWLQVAADFSTRPGWWSHQDPMLGIPSKFSELTIRKTNSTVGREPLRYEVTGRKSHTTANNRGAEAYFFMMNWSKGGAENESIFFFPVLLRRALVKDMLFHRVCFSLTWGICNRERCPWSKVPLVNRRMSSL